MHACCLSICLCGYLDESPNKRSLIDDEKADELSPKKNKPSVDPLSELDVKQQCIIEKLRSSSVDVFKCDPWCQRDAYGLKVYAVDHQLAHTLSGIMGRISEIELRLFDNNNEFRENVSMNEMMDTNSRRQLIKDVEYMRETTDSVDWSSVPDPWSDIDKPIKNLNTFYHLTLVNTRSDAGFTVKAGEKIRKCSLIGRLSGMKVCMGMDVHVY